jgi:hypothetical protein
MARFFRHGPEDKFMTQLIYRKLADCIWNLSVVSENEMPTGGGTSYLHMIGKKPA